MSRIQHILVLRDCFELVAEKKLSIVMPSVRAGAGAHKQDVELINKTFQIPMCDFGHVL